MSKDKIIALRKIPHSAEGLRDALFDEINSLRKGKDTVRRAKVIAQLAHRIIEAARLQLEVSGALEGKQTPLGSAKAAKMSAMPKNKI